MQYDLIVSMVTYRNDPRDLAVSVERIVGSDLNLKLVVVDNSPDDSLRAVCGGERVEYLRPGKNLGYGAGNNLALRQAVRQAKYALVTNPDLTIEPGTLERLQRFMEEHEDVGLVMPRLLGPSGEPRPGRKLLPTPADLIVRIAFSRLPFFKERFRRRQERYEFQFAGYDRQLDAPFLSGCFMFMRSSDLERAGLFDERFFLYLEDTDLCRRLHRVSRTVYLPDARVCHAEGRGSYKNARLFAIHVASAIKYFNKWGWLRDRERDEMNAKALRAAMSAVEAGAGTGREQGREQEVVALMRRVG